uniref:ER membrane protein complex subunit 9 n=1 Tax=Pelusios castaneus TaxID=367368 RepID=A0A8C8VJI4_9SAUR
MGEVEFSARAYAKMRLHAAAHPPATVTGLLLGRRAGPPACLCLADCVPLFHRGPTLGAMLDVALNQVDAWASRSNLLLAGCYQAKAGLDDTSPSPLVLKMAGRLAELFEDAVLIMLDNLKLTMDPQVPPVIVMEQRDQHWLPKDKNLAYTRLVDFDAHLDDIRLDWTNQQLNMEIAQLAAVANGST